MLDNPQIKSIVEIGTGRGALTTVFGLWGIKLDIPILSIDIVKLYDQNVLNKLNVVLLQQDEFSESTKEYILSFIKNKPTWIYCDGMSKLKEFLTYAPLIPKDSIISAHDLGTEFCDIEALSILGPNVVDRYKPEMWNDLNIRLSIFKKL
jgi:hypothetical protein